VRDVALGVAALGLALTMAAQGLAEHFAVARPDLAMTLAPGFADGTLAAADGALARNRTGAAIVLARRALRVEPLNAAALTILGLAFAKGGQQARADGALGAAGAMSWRVSEAQAWLLQRRLKEGRIDDALRHADALLRTGEDDRLQTRLFTLLNAAAALPAARGALVLRLGASPPWRQAFLAQLPASAATGVLDAMRAGPAPPTSIEFGPAIAALITAGDFQGGAAQWALLSPLARVTGGWPHDGSFQGGADGTDFTWSTPQGAGADADIETAPGPHGGRALRVEYDGYTLASFPRQLLVLAPGRYRLDWRQFTEAGEPNRLAWTVRCAGDGRLLGMATPGQGAPGGWNAATIAFETPPGCPAQWLALTPAPGERRQSIVVWYGAFRGRPAS
jgi:hypothetical protein